MSILALLLVVGCAGAWWLTACPDPLLYVALHFLALLLYWAGIVAGPPRPALALLAGLWLGVCWTQPQALWENDYYRYAWDGHLVLQGQNPFLYEPEHPALTSWRRTQDLQVAFPWVPTCYPPGAQLYFAAGESLTKFGLSSLGSLRLLALSLSAAVGLGLWQLCRHCQVSTSRIWIFCCSCVFHGKPVTDSTEGGRRFHGKPVADSTGRRSRIPREAGQRENRKHELYASLC